MGTRDEGKHKHTMNESFVETWDLESHGWVHRVRAQEFLKSMPELGHHRET